MKTATAWPVSDQEATKIPCSLHRAESIERGTVNVVRFEGGLWAGARALAAHVHSSRRIVAAVPVDAISHGRISTAIVRAVAIAVIATAIGLSTTIHAGGKRCVNRAAIVMVASGCTKYATGESANRGASANIAGMALPCHRTNDAAQCCTTYCPTDHRT